MNQTNTHKHVRHAWSDPEAEHNERAWSKRVWRPLLFLYGVK